MVVMEAVPHTERAWIASTGLNQQQAVWWSGERLQLGQCLKLGKRLLLGLSDVVHCGNIVVKVHFTLH